MILKKMYILYENILKEEIKKNNLNKLVDK